jgi:hypothetical protein
MQVGMIASDGIVLASDTKWITYPVRSGRKYRDVQHKSKIKIKGYLAVCCARDMGCSTLAADAILSHWNVTEQNYPQQVQNALKSLKAKLQKHEWECLIAISKPEMAFVHVLNVLVQREHTKPARWERFVNPVLRYCQTGDDSNDVRYWLRLYDPALSVRELQTLAAYLVVDAGSFNNTTIGGLEIARCTGSGFERIPDTESAKIEVEAQKMSAVIRKEVTKPAAT